MTVDISCFSALADPACLAPEQIRCATLLHAHPKGTSTIFPSGNWTSATGTWVPCLRAPQRMFVQGFSNVRVWYKQKEKNSLLGVRWTVYDFLLLCHVWGHNRRRRTRVHKTKISHSAGSSFRLWHTIHKHWSKNRLQGRICERSHELKVCVPWICIHEHTTYSM